MKIEFTHDFIKRYKKRFGHQTQIQKKFEERVRLFTQNPTNPILNNHPLKGKRRLVFAFSITGDIRVTYILVDNIAYFLDIGSHNQVY